MSRIPDCRTDDTYNQKYLNKEDKREIFGFDWCAEMAADNFFDNLETYANPELLAFLNAEIPEDEHEEYEWIPTINLGDQPPEPEKRTIRTYGDLLRSQLADWIESERDEIITSMIDAMDDDEYQRIKAEVDKAEKDGDSE